LLEKPSAKYSDRALQDISRDVAEMESLATECLHYSILENGDKSLDLEEGEWPPMVDELAHRLGMDACTTIRNEMSNPNVCCEW